MSVYADSNNPNSCQKILLVAMGLFVPPLPVFLLTEPNFSIWTMEFWITVVLTILGHVPGVLFAIYFVLIGFDKAKAGREGYIVIDEERDLEANPQPESVPEFVPESAPEDPVPASQPELAISKVEAPEPTESNEPEPPRYEDIVSPDQHYQSDSKQSGDNKVQS